LSKLPCSWIEGYVSTDFPGEPYLHLPRCGQVLAPSEQTEPPDDPRWWKLPTCYEPPAPGYNPLGLCGCHLALLRQRIALTDAPATPPGADLTLAVDFRQPHAIHLALEAGQARAQALAAQRKAPVFEVRAMPAPPPPIEPKRPRGRGKKSS
jgi:hypothetical protein